MLEEIGKVDCGVSEGLLPVLTRRALARFSSTASDSVQKVSRATHTSQNQMKSCVSQSLIFCIFFPYHNDGDGSRNSESISSRQQKITHHKVTASYASSQRTPNGNTSFSFAQGTTGTTSRRPPIQPRGLGGMGWAARMFVSHGKAG